MKRKLSLTELNKNNLMRKEMESIRGGYWGYSGGGGSGCFDNCSSSGRCGCVCVGPINGDTPDPTTNNALVVDYSNAQSNDYTNNRVDTAVGALGLAMALVC